MNDGTKSIPALPPALDWMRDPGLEACLVGSAALFLACGERGLPPPPEPHDLDLAWRPDPDEGARILTGKGFEVSATEGGLGRGTLAFRCEGRRFEITSFRCGGEGFAERIAEDASRRDMTIGAIYYRLSDRTIHDPMDGLEDWMHGRIRACGDVRDRIREHPIRALRYLRRASLLGFHLDPPTRKGLRASAREAAAGMLPEAVGQEIRRTLLECPSPGAFFQMCEEEDLLAPLIPELAPLFDGRAAGRIRHHAEVSQALHMILCLRVAAELSAERRLAEPRKHSLMLAVLCHDLGKGKTPGSALPSHHGHGAAGVPIVEAFFDRFPGLGNRRVRLFCKALARNHLILTKLRRLRPGTLADLWERDLRPFREELDLCALAVRSDKEGRLEAADIGLPPHPEHERRESPEELENRVLKDLEEIDAICRSVDGGESAAKFEGRPEDIRRDLRDRRIEAIVRAGYVR